MTRKEAERRYRIAVADMLEAMNEVASASKKLELALGRARYLLSIVGEKERNDEL